MRPVALVFALLCGLAGTTAQAMAQVVGIVGDRYESYSSQYTCVNVNCNFSFPLFVLPNNAPGTLLIEEISCSTMSETEAFSAKFGPTTSVNEFVGKKSAVFQYTSFPYNSFSNNYSASFRAQPNMMLVQNRYLTINIYFNPKPNAVIFYSSATCSMSGRILR